MTAPVVIARDRGTHATFLLYSDRVVLARLIDGLNLDETVGPLHLREMQEFVGDGDYIAVVDTRGIAYATPGGRQAVRDSISPRRRATGLIVDSRVLEFVVRQYLEEAQYPVQNATFDTEAAALEWAHELARSLLS